MGRERDNIAEVDSTVAFRNWFNVEGERATDEVAEITLADVVRDLSDKSALNCTL